MKIWGKNVNKSIDPYANSSYKACRSYERFRFVKDALARRMEDTGDFLDIGCAKGEFIWYLKDFFPKMRFTGVDNSSRLISFAKREPKLSDATFIKADVRRFDLKRRFDFVLMSGLLSVFDDFRQPLRQILRHLKPGGWGYIFGCFAESDVDVLVRFRNNFSGSTEWESGLNMFSLNTIKKALEPFSDNLDFRRFNLPIDLRRQDDPVRSYTLNTRERGRIIATGLNILLDLYLIEFKKRGTR